MAGEINNNDKQLCNIIIDAMVEHGYVAANAVKKLTGLEQEQAEVLANAISNDGVINQAELDNMRNMENSDRLVAMATFIGGTAKELYETAWTIRDVSRMMRFDRKDPCGVPLLGTDYVVYEEESDGHCWMTADARNAEMSAESWAVYDLADIQREGHDIYPAIEKMLEGFSEHANDGVLRALADSRLDLSALTYEQKGILVGKLRSFIYGGMKNSPDYSVAAIRILGKLGSQGLDALLEAQAKFAEMESNYSGWGIGDTYAEVTSRAAVEQLSAVFGCFAKDSFLEAFECLFA